jgi:MarR family transcriptional regulator, lower aerobic nicotinate degradation pathway regulator
MPPASKKAGAATADTRRVLDSIRRIVRVLRLASRDAEKRVGLSAAQLFVLQKLAEGGVLSVNELAQRTHTHQSSVSVVVRRLVQQGYADRMRSASDARQAEVSVPASGNAVLRSAPTAAQDRIFVALNQMSGGDVHVLAEAMDKLVHRLGIDGTDAVPMLFEDESPKGGSRRKPRAS